MPQLDFSTFASQIFWLVITFATLYLVLVKKALPRLGEVMQDRRERIADDLEAAESYRQRAEALETEYLASMRDARARAQEITGELQRESDKVAAQRFAELDKVLKKKAAEAEASIERAQHEALLRILPISIDLTQVVLKKVIHADVPRERIEQVVNQRVKEIKHV